MQFKEKILKKKEFWMVRCENHRIEEVHTK